MPDPTDIDPDGPEEDAAENAYDPDEVEVTRGRQQGLGVGARDLALQQDPNGPGGGGRNDDVERIEADDEDDAPNDTLGARGDNPRIDRPAV